MTPRKRILPRSLFLPRSMKSSGNSHYLPKKTDRSLERRRHQTRYLQDTYFLVKNLVENGILYNLRGGNVKVRMKNNTLVVLDDGIKIQEKDQGRIFKRFYRVDKSHNREKSVTGLGLSIVKHIVMKYHTTIQLESTPGYGSAFIVTFPDNVYQWT